MFWAIITAPQAEAAVTVRRRFFQLDRKILTLLILDKRNLILFIFGGLMNLL